MPSAAQCFPQDDGDEYFSLCLRAKPDHATDIRRVFSETPSGPAFAVIDAIGGGVSWPQLRATLDAVSGREILAALLAPNAHQTEALKAQEGWAQEARDFLRATLAMTVKTRGKTWTGLADELWRCAVQRIRLRLAWGVAGNSQGCAARAYGSQADR